MAEAEREITRSTKRLQKNDLSEIIRDQLSRIPEHPLLSISSTDDQGKRSAQIRRRQKHGFAVPFSRSLTGSKRVPSVPQTASTSTSKRKSVSEIADTSPRRTPMTNEEDSENVPTTTRQRSGLGEQFANAIHSTRRSPGFSEPAKKKKKSKMDVPPSRYNFKK